MHTCVFGGRGCRFNGSHASHMTSGAVVNTVAQAQQTISLVVHTAVNAPGCLCLLPFTPKTVCALDISCMACSCRSCHSLQTALSRSRKQLTVELGPLLEDPSDHSNSNGSAPGTPTGKRRGAVKKLQQQKQQQERAQEKALQLAQQRQAAGNGAGRQQAVGPAGGDFRQSPMFRRFFVAGNSDAPDAQPNTTSEEEEAAEVPDIAPQEIWDKVPEAFFQHGGVLCEGCCRQC